MGATDCSFTVKGKDRAALTKNFWKHVREAQHENGHGGYTGTAAEFSQIVFTTRVFNVYSELQDFVSGLNDKNVAYMVQLKIIKDSPTIAKWQAQITEMNRSIWTMTSEKERAKAHKTVEAIYAKIKAARIRKAEASKRTEWVACGWVSE